MKFRIEFLRTDITAAKPHYMYKLVKILTLKITISGLKLIMKGGLEVFILKSHQGRC